MAGNVISTWHRVMQQRDVAGLSALLAEDAVFHSPVVHRPIEGKAGVLMYLTAAFHVFGDPSFRYVREVEQGHDAVLEFELTLDGIAINGVDMIRWNAAGQIVYFKVMIRPLKAINLIHQKMGEMLQRLPAA